MAFFFANSFTISSHAFLAHFLAIAFVLWINHAVALGAVYALNHSIGAVNQAYTSFSNLSSSIIISIEC